MCRFRPLKTGAQCHGRSTTRKSCTLGDGHCNATNEIFGVLVGAGSGVGVGGRRDWIQDCKVWDLMLEYMRVFKLKWYLKLSPTEMFLRAGFWWGERSSSASIGIFYSKKLGVLGSNDMPRCTNRFLPYHQNRIVLNLGQYDSKGQVIWLVTCRISGSLFGLQRFVLHDSWRFVALEQDDML